MMRLASFIGLLILAAGFPSSALEVENDLDVLFIERLPAISWVHGSEQPGVEGWPAEGQQVTWVAHVANRSSSPMTVRSRWRVDREIVQDDYRTLEAGNNAIGWTSVWTAKRQTIEFEIDADKRVAETSERNNFLLTFSDAIAIGFWVERTFEKTFNSDRVLRSIGVNSVEDWLQLQVLRLNGMAALAVYPESPRGVADRFRIDHVVIVDDGRLPLSPPPAGYSGPRPVMASIFPDVGDRTVDLEWGFPAENSGFYSGAGLDAYFDQSLLHELGHARYLVDTYRWNMGSRRGDVFMMSPAPPEDASGHVYRTRLRGLMNQHYGFIDRYSAAALNLIAGHRATRGNFNPPGNLGVFLEDYPAENAVRLVTADGVPVANAEVRLFASDGMRRYDATPEATLVSDAQGTIEVGRDPFGPNPGNDQRAVVLQVETGGASRFGFLEASQFNLAYWRGERERAIHDVIVGPTGCTVSPTGAGPGPANGIFKVARGSAVLRWDPVPRAQEYRVSVSVDGGEPRVVATTSTTSAEVIVDGVVFWSVDAIVAGCEPIRGNVGVVLPDREPRRRPVRR